MTSLFCSLQPWAVVNSGGQCNDSLLSFSLFSLSLTISLSLIVPSEGSVGEASNDPFSFFLLL